MGSCPIPCTQRSSVSAHCIMTKCRQRVLPLESLQVLQPWHFLRALSQLHCSASLGCSLLPAGCLMASDSLLLPPCGYTFLPTRQRWFQKGRSTNTLQHPHTGRLNKSSTHTHTHTRTYLYLLTHAFLKTASQENH